MERNEHLEPFAALLAAAVAGALCLLWQQTTEAPWAPVVVYTLLAAVGAWWCHTRLGPRSTAAFLVASAVMVGLLLPFGVLELSPPT